MDNNKPAKPAIVVKVDKNNNKSLKFDVRVKLLDGDSEHFSEPSDFEYEKEFGVPERFELIKKIWNVNGVIAITINRYSIQVEIGNAFFASEVREKITKIIEDEIQLDDTTQQVLDDAMESVEKKKKEKEKKKESEK